MTTAYTSLLGLALPVQGELSGTWGDMVDNAITSPLDVAVAGTQTISGSQTAVTLSVTNGNSSATNLAQAGSGATGSAQYAIINCTGNPASLLTITAPASSRQYTILNSTSTSQSVKIVGAGPTAGVTIVSGEKATVTWNGTDYVKIATTTSGTGSVTSVAQSFTGGLIAVGGSPITSSGTLALTVAGTSGGIPYFSSGTAWATSAALTQYGVVYGGGAGASPAATAAGTTTTVLHGNAAGAPTFGAVSLTADVSGTLPIANGGTAAVSAPAAMANLMGFTSTATAAGTTTLTNTSSYYQQFTGATTQIVKLPVTSTLVTGWTFHIVNNSTGNVSVQSSGANAVITVLPGTTAMCTCIGTALTTAADWESGLTDFSTATGTGNVVLSTSPTLVTPVLGTPTSGTLSGCTVDGTNALGYINIPFNSQSAAYTLVIGDAGKCIFHPSTDANARTFTIPANGSVAFVVGTAISFINMTSQVVTIAITTDTMYLSSAGTTGSRSLAQYGTATAVKMTSTTWIISGSGLT